MAKKQLRRKKNSHPYKNLPLDIAIGIAGILLIGFIYSLSQNTIHTGVPIEVRFPEIDSPKMLAKEIYSADPIKNIKVEILNAESMTRQHGDCLAGREDVHSVARYRRTSTSNSLMQLGQGLCIMPT